MQTVRFFKTVAVRDDPGRWEETNRAVRRLIRLHAARLEPVVGIAERIRRGMEFLFPIMDDLCRPTCPACLKPCCVVTRVWLDFRDLLFLHLLETIIPPAQLTWERTGKCCYLARGGCMLPRLIRPWACTLYLCPAHLAALRKEGVHLGDVIEEIREDRMKMEAEFNLTVLGQGPSAPRQGGGLQTEDLSW